MFNITETASKAYDWLNGFVRGVDTTDYVLGGANGAANASATDLALRTRNLHDRLAAIEVLLQEDSNTTIDNVRDVLNAFQGMDEGSGKLLQIFAQKVAKDGSNLTAADVTAWLNVLKIYTQAQIDSKFATTNSQWSAAVTNEASARASGIANEASTRASADASLQGQVNNLGAAIPYYAKLDGSNLNSGIFSKTTWLNYLGLSRGVKMIGRTEVYLGDIGAGFTTCNIGYNVGISVVYRYASGTTFGTFTVPSGCSLFYVQLTENVNIRKVSTLLVLETDETTIYPYRVVSTGSNSTSGLCFVIRESASVTQGIYATLTIMGEILDYQ